MRKAYVLIILLLTIVVILSIGKVVVYNTLSTSGIFVSKTEQEINFYKTQNAILSEELLVVSSLTNIAEKAKESGFINKNTLMVLKTSESLAVKP
jgi:cell division protein FtsL